MTAIENALSAFAGKEVRIDASADVGGGCINRARRLETSAGIFFLKTNEAARFSGMFEAEAKGLKKLLSTQSLRIPGVVAVGESDNTAFLILEYIVAGARKKDFWQQFGISMARLHRNSLSRFGLDHNNYIGSLPQSNSMHEDWLSFFIGERLQPQVQRALDAQLLQRSHFKKFESLFKKISVIFPNEKPALLHGDLWSGNFMSDAKGEPCIFDPAVYYGNREMEIAFTQLFGGFDSEFYQAYHEAFPLQPGFESRRDIYNLYPLLVHLNLFGSSYLHDIEMILGKVGN